jgi:hypothetical protein
LRKQIWIYTVISNDRHFDQKRSKLFYMDRTFLPFAESKSMPPKLWHGFTQRFQ